MKRATAGLIIVATIACMPVAAALAQGIGKETVPGGVEAKPSTPDASRPATGGAMPPPATAPAMAPPPVAAPKPVMPEPAKPAASPKKDDSGDDVMKKKSKKKAAAPRAMSRGIAPAEAPAAGAAPGGPTVGGNESKPGAVERMPGAPVAPRQ